MPPLTRSTCHGWLAMPAVAGVHRGYAAAVHALREHKDREISSATRSFSHAANKIRELGSVSSCQPDLRAGTGAQIFSSVSASERHRTAGEQAASFGRKLGPFARGASGRNGGQRACRRRRHGEGEQQRRESCKEKAALPALSTLLAAGKIALTATSLGLMARELQSNFEADDPPKKETSKSMTPAFGRRRAATGSRTRYR